MNKFHIGDYVRFVDELSISKCSLVYRIEDRLPALNWVLKPIYGLFNSTLNVGYYYATSSEIEKVSLLEMSFEFNKFVNFVNQMAKAYGAEALECPKIIQKTNGDGDNDSTPSNS